MTKPRRTPWRPPLVLGTTSKGRAITIAPGQATTYETEWFDLCMIRGLHELFRGRERVQYNYSIVQAAAELDLSAPLPDEIDNIALQVAMTATIGCVTGWCRLEESGTVSQNGPGLSLPGRPLAVALLENRGRAQAYGIAARVRITKKQGDVAPFPGILTASFLLSDPVFSGQELP